MGVNPAGTCAKQKFENRIIIPMPNENFHFLFAGKTLSTVEFNFSIKPILLISSNLQSYLLCTLHFELSTFNFKLFTFHFSLFTFPSLPSLSSTRHQIHFPVLLHASYTLHFSHLL